MREILFRGKRVHDGEWVYGAYQPPVEWGGREWDVSIAYKTEYGWLEDVLVIPETVGQFTGLTDKNGKRIFEGDILDYWSSYSETLCGSYETVVFGVNNCSCCHAVYGWSTKNEYGYGRYIENTEECVVIGNIHDNPELLEG